MPTLELPDPDVSDLDAENPALKEEADHVKILKAGSGSGLSPFHRGG